MIEVFANGRKFSSWTEARVSRSLDRIAATFSLTLVARSSDGDRVRLFPGDSVTVSVDGVKVINGYVDDLKASFSSGNHAISVTGSEKTADIADCSIESPLEWKDKTMSEIVDSICKFFGLKFSNKMGVDVGKAFPRFAVEPGAKALDTIAKLCKERGILPCSDGLGGVFLLKPESCARGPALKQGENLLSASVEFSLVDRFSKYSVYGTGRKKVVGEASDADVVRTRPIVIVDSNSVDKEQVQARADWECKVRKAKSMKFSASVSGWSHSGGLWAPGVICSLFAPEAFVETPVDLLVSSVEYSWGSSGSVANLTLVSPDVYAPQPESKKKKAKKGVKSDPWDSVKKAVSGK